MLGRTPLTYWLTLVCCLARLSRADYACLCNYQVELPIYIAMDTTTTPVGYMYEFDCKPVATVNYPTTGWNVVMSEHQIAFVESSSSVLVQVCQGVIPSDDKVTNMPSQNNATSIRPLVTDTATSSTTATTTVKTQTTTTTTQPITTPRATTHSESTSLKSTTTASSTTVTTTTMKPSTATTRRTTIAQTPSPSSTTTMQKMTTSEAKTTVMNNLALSQVAGNLNLCPQSLTQSTDARWIRQYNNFCYEIVSGRYEDWYDALQDCHDRHGDDVDGTLLEVYTADIQQFIEKFLQEENYNHPVWIGLQDVDQEETFDHWETDTKLTYENFDPNRKDNYAPHGKEDCVLLEPSGLWDDSICSEDDAISVSDGGKTLLYRHSYICQYRTTNTPTTTTTSSPTTVNILTANITGNIQLCPQVVRDTTDASQLRQYNQYCYELVSKFGDWYEANQYCRDRETGLNGLLIEIYTADIQQFIAKALAEEGYNHPLWIGLQDVDKEESFDHWESDIPLKFSNFDPNRKDNYANHAQENCVLLEPTGYWDDSVCDETEANQAEQDGHPGLIYNHHWICQYPIRQQIIFG